MTGENSEQINMEPPQIYVERTLAIIKPDAVHKSEELQDIILRSGFAILQVRASGCSGGWDKIKQQHIVHQDLVYWWNDYSDIYSLETRKLIIIHQDLAVGGEISP